VPGSGSTFSVHLPLTTCQAQPQTGAPPPRRAPAPHESGDEARRVLLVEDDPIAGPAIAGLIETFGYRVTLATQALAALSDVESDGAYDAMVFDFDLPGMDGCELATLLRQRGVTTPIVALTASAHGDEERRASDAGMNAFLRKPVLPEPLRDALDSVFEKASS
jgi:CheY-like chemotaxis protein